MSEGAGGARRLRVAFVTQRYGVEVNGGAEAHCRTVAERMAAHWDVEAFSTCALDYMTWQDHYPAGDEVVNGVTVHRYPVERPRDIAAFNALSARIHADPHPTREQCDEWMRAQGPWSPALLDALEGAADRVDLFIFFGYLYAQTYFGLPRVAHKAVLAPLAHDEWTIHLPAWERVFAAPRGFVFNTEVERDFLRRRFPSLPIEGPVVAVAVERPAGVDPRRFRDAHGIEEDFLVYVGRVDPSKGCGEMFAHFLAHVDRTGDPRLLVTMGREMMPVPKHPQVRSLGFVDETTKWDALAACDVLLMPSPFESLSMALLEAWGVGKPVLVNAACDVLLSQVRRANGGLAYRDGQEFSHLLQLLSEGSVPGVLGRQGYEFVSRHYTWERIVSDYLALGRSLTSMATSAPATPCASNQATPS
jgi:glycosyltransferase involved in cell wall biosynthesis